MTIVDTSAAPARQTDPDQLDGFRVSLTETWWGYVIRTERVRSSVRRLVDLAAALVAVGFALAAVVIWLAPIDDASGAAILLKGAGSSLMALLALLVSYLSRGDDVSEVQIDCNRAELRLMARPTGERLRLVGRYGFEEIGGVFIDRGATTRLMARYRNTPHLVTIATGPGPRLERLRDRLGRDLLGTPAPH